MMRHLLTGIFLLLLVLSSHAASPPSANTTDGSSNARLLIVIPTSGHPTEFFATLDAYYKNLSKEVPYRFLVACDLNDASMNTQEVKTRLGEYPHLTVIYSKQLSKPDTYNNAVSKFSGQFDILLAANETLEPVEHGYDKKIVAAMNKNFADYDGVINFHAEPNLPINTTPVIGKAFYQRLGYVYHPDYQADYFDQELTQVSRILGKEADIQEGLLKSKTGATVAAKPDAIADKALFLKRRAATFDLDDNLLSSLFPKDWSILICTLDEREKQFTKLYNELSKQIADNNLGDKVEILFFKDNRVHTVGFKRNSLLKQSRGMYVNYIDDDDDVHANYIAMIHGALKSRPDCVSLVGIITFNGNQPATFLHSVKYNTYFQQNGVYFRPPNHLNTMKRAVAAQFVFPNISYGEDTNWAMQIAQTGLLKKEAPINTPYYFYKYVDK